MAHGRMLDDDHVPLQQFFVVLEHVLRHNIKRKYTGHCDITNQLTGEAKKI